MLEAARKEKFGVAMCSKYLHCVAMPIGRENVMQWKQRWTIWEQFWSDDISYFSMGIYYCKFNSRCVL